MNVDAIKDLMNKCLVTEVVDAAELAKLSDDDIRANYITQVVDLAEFSNDDVEAPTEAPTDEPTDEPADDTDSPVVDEGGDETPTNEVETPTEEEGEF